MHWLLQQKSIYPDALLYNCHYFSKYSCFSSFYPPFERKVTERARGSHFPVHFVGSRFHHQYRGFHRYFEFSSFSYGTNFLQFYHSRDPPIQEAEKGWRKCQITIWFGQLLQLGSSFWKKLGNLANTDIFIRVRSFRRWSSLANREWRGRRNDRMIIFIWCK